MDSLLLHDTSLRQFKRLLKQPSHAVLITGNEGSGKQSSARFLAAGLLNIDAQALDSYPFFIRMSPKNSSEIPIDEVRQLLRKLRLKAPGSKPLRRVVLIEEGHKMSREAQTAILKMLEEPGGDTVFLITAKTKNSVLPTIASRAQHIQLQPVPFKSALSFFGDRFNPKTIKSNWLLSRGAPGLLQTLLEDNDIHPLKQSVDQSKVFLRLDRYERLVYLEQLLSARDDLRLFFDALGRVLAALHQESISSATDSKSDRLLRSRKLLHELEQALDQNVSPKLVCLKLVMNLPV